MPTSEHFSNNELSCNHCGKNEMDPEFLSWLEQVRELYGKPMVLSSAYRCPEYNAQVSSTGTTGPHTTGKAVDVLVNGKDAVRLERAAVLLCVNGKGTKQKGPWGGRFLHLDLVDRKAIWSY